MSNWHAVKGRKTVDQRRRSSSRQESNDWSEEKVHSFLSTFKTKQCTRVSEGHDPRLCPHFHTDSDKRRNPYVVDYDVDDHKNAFEKMYHPLLFKTSMCRNSPCDFGSQCAHAHSTTELRATGAAAQSFTSVPVLKRQKPHLASFMPVVQQFVSMNVQGSRLLHELHREMRMPIEETRLRLTDRQDFLVKIRVFSRRDSRTRPREWTLHH